MGLVWPVTSTALAVMLLHQEGKRTVRSVAGGSGSLLRSCSSNRASIAACVLADSRVQTPRKCCKASNISMNKNGCGNKTYITPASGYRRLGSKQIHGREYGCLQGVQGLMHSQTKYACIFCSYLCPFSRDCPASNKTGAADSLLRPAALCAVLNSSITSNNTYSES